MPSADLDIDAEGVESEHGQSDDNEDYVPGQQKVKPSKKREPEEAYCEDSDSEIAIQDAVTGADLDGLDELNA